MSHHTVTETYAEKVKKSLQLSSTPKEKSTFSGVETNPLSLPSSGVETNPTPLPSETLCRYFNTSSGCKDGDECAFIHSRVCIFYPNCWRGDRCFYPHANVDEIKDSEPICQTINCPRFVVGDDLYCKLCLINNSAERFSVCQPVSKTCRWCFGVLVNGLCNVCLHNCESPGCLNSTYYKWCKTCYLLRTQCPFCKTKKIAGKCPQCEGHACGNAHCSNQAVKELCQQCYKEEYGPVTCDQCYSVLSPGNVCLCNFHVT